MIKTTDKIQFPKDVLKRQMEKLSDVYRGLCDLAAKENDQAKARELHQLAHNTNHVIAIIDNEILLIERRKEAKDEVP